MCMCDLNPNLETHPSLVRITNWRPEQLVVLLWRCNLNIPALLLEALKRPLNSPKPKTLNPTPETLNPWSLKRDLPENLEDLALLGPGQLRSAVLGKIVLGAFWPPAFRV